MDYKLVQDKNIILTSNPEEQIPEIATELVQILKSENKKISLAESCTGGMVAESITNVSGSSDVFECGVVTYSNAFKEQLIDVDQNFLKENGPINSETATMMANGVKKLATSDIGIGITGVAGPGPDGSHPEGEIYIAAAIGTSTYVIKLMTDTDNKRNYNRKLATLNAINLAVQVLKDNI